MAIYYFDCQIISRGSGRSAVAAAAYRAGERITNEYDGVTHDYTHKSKVAYSEILLPENAPRDFLNRSTLWNSVEDIEKSIDAQLAREIVVALPSELSLDQQILLARKYVQETYVSQGMCADIAIHTPEHASTATGEIVSNPHMHCMLTIRPLDKDGQWEPKAVKAYLCAKDGEKDRAFTSAEYPEAVKNGWQKQYQYRKNGKKVWLTPEKAEEQGLERLGRNPRSKKITNPTLELWNSKASLQSWRKGWADAVNTALEAAGYNASVDHRSYEEQGLLQVGTIHEGATATALEREGIRTDRGDINRVIREGNQRISLHLENAERYQRDLQKLVGGEYITLPYTTGMQTQGLRMS